MGKKIVIGVIIIAVLAVILLLAASERKENGQPMPKEEARKLAGDWIVDNAPTYLCDGFDLAFIESEEIGEGRYRLSFSFESRSAGYGDRKDEITAQVITPHAIEILVENGQVIEAVTDGVYDELKGEMLEQTSTETMQIELCFTMVIDGQEKLVHVPREIPRTPAPARAALEALLAGPITGGISTAIPEGAELKSITVEDGVARADFNEKLQQGVAGSARVTAIREQIERTLLQFDTIDEVVITIEGESEGILQP